MKVARRYGVMRVIAFILKLLAWLILLLCVAAAIFGATLVGRSVPGVTGLTATIGVSTIVGAALTGVFGFLPLFAMGSVLSLLLDIEENTRALAVIVQGDDTPNQMQT